MRVTDLPCGTCIREPLSGVDFLIAAKHHPGYEGVTLITDKIIAQGCLDAPEPENPDENRRITGNENYALSNLHQWLNAEGMNWYVPSHPFDTPPSQEQLSVRPSVFGTYGANAYVDKPGFLSWFGKTFKGHILSSKIPCLDQTQENIEYIDAKFFLPSAAEAGVKVFGEAEGSKFSLFDDFRMRFAAPSEDSIMSSEWQPAYYKTDSLQWYWLRTPKPNDTGFSYYVHFVSPYSFKFVSQGWMGIRPCVNVDETMEVLPSVNRPGTYVFA